MVAACCSLHGYGSGEQFVEKEQGDIGTSSIASPGGSGSLLPWRWKKQHPRLRGCPRTDHSGNACRRYPPWPQPSTCNGPCCFHGCCDLGTCEFPLRQHEQKPPDRTRQTDARLWKQAGLKNLEDEAKTKPHQAAGCSSPVYRDNMWPLRAWPWVDCRPHLWRLLQSFQNCRSVLGASRGTCAVSRGPRTRLFEEVQVLQEGPARAISAAKAGQGFVSQ